MAQETPDPAKPVPAQEPHEKRKPARKMRGPFAFLKTVCTSFEKGKTRDIEVMVTPTHMVYRLKGRQDTFAVTHEAAYLKAVSIGIGFSIEPRTGRVTRGSK